MSSGFISEAELVEVRKRRQEEWEKVRKPSDPIERPEEPYDNRSLFDRLQEQKQKKELEYEEAHKLKNMIKGLDDDEVEFLDLVDRTKIAADRRKEIEEERELKDYRNRVAVLQEKTIEERFQAEIGANKSKAPSGAQNNQQKLLKGVIVKRPNTKTGDEEPSPKQQKLAQGDCDRNPESTDDTKPGLKCVAILPGLGHYNDSSSDENSSDTDNSEIEIKSRIDLLGRKIETKVVEKQQK